MSEERSDLLGAVRDAARAEEADGLSDPRWDAMARGELSAEERAELEALAKDDPAMAGAPELFAPLDDVTRQRFLRAAKGGAPEAGAAKKGAPSSMGRRLFLGASAVAAVAASATLWWRFGRRRETDLPLYELSVAGGGRAHRDDNPGETTLAPGARVVLSLRPQKSVQGPVEVRAFLVQGATRVSLEGGMLQQSMDGSLKLIGRVPNDVPFTPGALDVIAALARPDTMGPGLSPPDGAFESGERGDGLLWTRSSVKFTRR